MGGKDKYSIYNTGHEWPLLLLPKYNLIKCLCVMTISCEGIFTKTNITFSDLNFLA